MKRTKVEWSNDVDMIEGPCAVCQKEVRFVIPSDRPNPSLLYHSTCEMMPLIREQLKKATIPLLPQNYLVKVVTPTPAVPAASAPAEPPKPTA